MKKTSTMLMLFPVALGTFMSAMDGSVVNISYPVIMKDFNITQGTVEWVITAYLLVVTSELLFFGRLSDLYGQKRVFMIGFAIFTAGSALCSLSTSAGMLIGLRVFQGIGAGMMFSTNSAIITHNVPAKNRGKAFSVIAMAVAVALSTGPVLGGVLTDNFGWQSIFYINVPVGILGLILAALFIPADKKTPSASLDIQGTLMIFAALFLILLPLDRIGAGMSAYLIVPMLLCGIMLIAIFIRHEKKAHDPIINLSLFRNRVFSASLAAAVLSFMAQNIMIFLAPLYLETIRLFKPGMAGLLFIPMPLTMLVIAPIAGYISDRFDTRYISSAGMAVMAVGLFLLSFVNLTTPIWYMVISMILTGIGCGLFQTPNNCAVMNNVPAANRGIASGMLATARNTGMVIGVGLSGALFLFFSGIASNDYAMQGITGDALNQSSFIFGLHITFIIAALVALAAMVASLIKGKVKTGIMLETQSHANE